MSLRSYLNFDLCLSPPGPLRRVQLGCGLRRAYDALGWQSACYAHDGEQCSEGDDKETCPHAVWLELDCSGPDADCSGLDIEPEREDAGTELEGVAAWLCEVANPPPEWGRWPEVLQEAHVSAYYTAVVQSYRDSAARFMAQARITTGDCDPDPGLEIFAQFGKGRAALARA
jgi:hypothetical protein